MNVPSVRARLTLLPDLRCPRWPNRARYMAHIVIGDPTQLQAHIGPGITHGALPRSACLGRARRINAGFDYGRDTKSDVLARRRTYGGYPNATFTLREGPLIVGFGEIITSRTLSSKS
jgi:hypothetical protein